MISNISEYINNKDLIKNPEVNEIWGAIGDMCSSHKLLFDLFNIQQERIVYLEKVLGSSAILPTCMQ